MALIANRWWWQARGYTPAAVECWNGMRALDYLQSRPEVDPDRLAVTGISGGGAASFWVAAADERVKVAAQDCLTLLQARIEREQHGDSLLRAAASPSAAANTLVRASTPGSATEPDELLRSSIDSEGNP